MLYVAVIAFVMLVIERLVRARSFPSRRDWYRRAVALNVIQVIVAYVGTMTWDVLMQDHRWYVFDGSPLSGALIGYLTITFIYYWWHRARHQNEILWRVFHQVHHSPSRLELVTSFYKHPLEVVANGLLSSAILYLLVGLSPELAAVVVAMTGVAELYYHWNVRTPYWTGFLFQRPEMHCIHHEAGQHRNNYSDLPLWDLLFGTFSNPHHSSFVCGFTERRERQLGAMLLARTVEDESHA